MKAREGVSVTIGIPTYSRLHYLKESTASALAQTYPNLEILLSQNPHPNSAIREPIAKYCRGLAANDSRVRYQLLPEDVGPPANFNAIADKASGEYLMMIGDDDHLLPGAVQKLACSLRPDTVLVFGRRYVIDLEGKRHMQFADSQPGGLPPPPAGCLTDPEPWAWQQAMATETSLIRTRDFRRLRFRENVDMPDMEFFVLLARERGEFIYTPTFVTEIRVHADSTTGRGFVNYRELADLLGPLQVTPEVEPDKTRKMEWLTYMAVVSTVAVGEVHHARRLLRSEYFPRKHSIPITRLCAALPGRLAAPLYGTYRRLRNGPYRGPAALA
jgi:glycosyltransferase involved in cell wall biosynthesis